MLVLSVMIAKSAWYPRASVSYSIYPSSTRPSPFCKRSFTSPPSLIRSLSSVESSAGDIEMEMRIVNEM